MGQDSPQQRYELVTTLGKGGMAEVFLGWMNSVGGLRRKVAIKRILPDLAQKQNELFSNMFVDEARLAFQLEHDNIVRVYDVGQSANTFFIVMEYVEGMDLKRIYDKLVERRQYLPVDVALYIVSQVCLGLAYAHGMTDDDGQQLGLIHNDISPPNVLVGRYGEVKVADFGLSDAVSNDVVTPEGMVKGKFAYISPESTRDPSLVSNKSDIFSTGIVFWELLANQRLFQRSNDLDTFKAVRACEVPPLHAIRNDISPELDTIVAKSLASDPMQRYASAEEMYDDICRYAAREGISLSRYNLCRVVNELADHSWTGFSGESVSGRMMADLLSELDGMLPPGVAQHLKSFVTRASEAQDVEQNAYVQEDFGDVFDEVGFDQGEVEPGSFADAEATHNIATSALIDQAAASSKAGESSAPRTPAPRTPAPRTPAPKTPAPAVARTPAPSAVPEDVLQQLREQANAHVRSQRMMAIIWGLVGGIVLGAGLGFVLAMAI